MQKTKLGITVALMGAALYFMGLINILGLVILAGYVLLFEENEWLKKSAVKAVTIVFAFALISVVVSFSNDIFGVINNIISWFDSSVRISWPLSLDSIVLNIINALEKLILIILGFKAFSQSSLSIGPIDKVVNKNMNI